MDNNKAWLAAGLALQRLLLVATKADYSTSYLNQPIEVSELRTRLATELRTARYPPLLLRVGRGSTAAAFAATSNGRRAIVIDTPFS